MFTSSAYVQDVVSEVAAAKELFDKASDILSYDLLKVCTEGQPHALTVITTSHAMLHTCHQTLQSQHAHSLQSVQHAWQGCFLQL